MEAVVKSFADLKLNNWILRQCSALGLKVPTPIQANCIPHILNGEDCIGCAETGSGKTLTFVLPMLQKLCEDPYGIFALVLTPTRELAVQIAEQFDIIGKPINLRHCVVVGGMDMVAQGQTLSRNPHIVIATPGRLADHLESCDTFSLKKIKFLVLDEADRLLSGQFDAQLKTIFQAIPASRQMLMFSATITDTLLQIREITAEKAFMYQCTVPANTVKSLDQYYVTCPPNAKDAFTVEIIRKFREKSSKGSVLIFTDTCRECQLLSMAIGEVGFESVALHSMMPQRKRVASLANFRSNTIRILIATDVASRGLDIPAVEMVINHNVPSAPKDYIHRVGRTARAGRGGTAILLITQYDLSRLHAIEEAIDVKLKEYTVDGGEVSKYMLKVLVSKREAAIKLDETDFYEQKNKNKKKKLIMEGKDPDEVEAEERKRKRRLAKIRAKQRRGMQKSVWEVRTLESTGGSEEKKTEISESVHSVQV
ncbi:probable ATP-dependent RNA helicase DDX49 [Hetaerina americana]|uniref:probable ATP-dependent RNA helicase DDX49 n=1 Tax=Hetaerina americana TaxID=62018 RepID=UPI003A7F53BB